jgi:hypothetical protein
MPYFKATRSEGSSPVKYLFFVLALMHASVSLSAESALPPAQGPAFAPAKRSSKDMGKPGTINCENSSVGRVNGPARGWRRSLSASAFD